MFTEQNGEIDEQAKKSPGRLLAGHPGEERAAGAGDPTYQDCTSILSQGQSPKTATYNQLCQICEVDQDISWYFLADNGRIPLCVGCATLFGFVGVEDGSKQ